MADMRLFFLGVGVLHTDCIGCNDLLQVGNTSYYCRGMNKILFFRCDIIGGPGINWLINDVVIDTINNVDSGNTFQTIEGYISIYTQTVDINDDGFRNNVTSYLWFNTADLQEETTVTCSGAGRRESVNVKSLGKIYYIHNKSDQLILIWSSYNISFCNS